MAARAPTSEASTRTVVITPKRRLLQLNLGELWRHREVGYFLVWRDLKVRYKQTAIGATWAVVQPLVLMVVFTFVLGRTRALAPPEGIPGPIFYFSALLPWTYFASALQTSTNSVINSQAVIKKVYFPRLMLPLAGVVPALLDFLISFVVLVVLMIGYDVPFTVRMLAVVPLIALAALSAFAAGTWLSSTYALYRDVGQAVPFLIQVLLFTSPVIIPAQRVPEWFRPIYGLNPIAGVIEGVRWAVTGVGAFPWDLVRSGIAVAVVGALAGIVYFHRVEDVVVDVV